MKEREDLTLPVQSWEVKGNEIKAKDQLPNGKRGATVTKYLVICIQSRTCVSHVWERQSHSAGSVSHTALFAHGQKQMLQHGRAHRKVPPTPVAPHNIGGFGTSWGTHVSKVFTLHRLCVQRTSISWVPSEWEPKQASNFFKSILGFEVPEAEERTEEKASLFSTHDSLPCVLQGARSCWNVGSSLWKCLLGHTGTFSCWISAVQAPV